MFNETWFVFAIRKLSFDDDDGNPITGYQVWFTRPAYPDEEHRGWYCNNVVPYSKKPIFVNEDLGKKLVSIMDGLETNKVSAVYQPEGRYNRLVGFERCSDE